MTLEAEAVVGEQGEPATKSIMYSTANEKVMNGLNYNNKTRLRNKHLNFLFLSILLQSVALWFRHYLNCKECDRVRIPVRMPCGIMATCREAHGSAVQK